MAKIKNNRNAEVKRGDVYRDMISGKNVTVTAVSKETVALDDGRKINDMVCFKYIENSAAPLEVAKTDFTVTNGTFAFKGEKIATGTLEVKEIITVVPGGVLVTAADNRRNGVVKVYKYTVEEDTFEELFEHVSNVEVIYEKESVLVIKVSSISERKIPDEKDPEAEPITVEGGFESIAIMLNGEIEKTIEGHFGAVDKTVEKEKETVLIMKSDKCFKECKDVDGYTFFRLVSAGDGVTEIQELILERIYDKDEDTEEERIFCINGYDYRHSVAEPIKCINVTNDANDNKNSLFIVTENSIIHTFNGHYRRQACGADVVKAATDFPYCVKLEAGRIVNKFYLANKYYETVCVTVTLTDDRGYVTEIE